MTNTAMVPDDIGSLLRLGYFELAKQNVEDDLCSHKCNQATVSVRKETITHLFLIERI